MPPTLFFSHGILWPVSRQLERVVIDGTLDAMSRYGTQPDATLDRLMRASGCSRMSLNLYLVEPEEGDVGVQPRISRTARARPELEVFYTVTPDMVRLQGAQGREYVAELFDDLWARAHTLKPARSKRDRNAPPIVEIRIPIPADSPVDWVEAVTLCLFEGANDGSHDGGESDGDWYVWEITGASTEELVTDARRALALPNVPGGGHIFVTDHERSYQREMPVRE